MIFLEDFEEHKVILEQLGWSLYDIEGLNGVEAQLLMTCIEQQQEINTLKGLLDN